jgi:hypothetical protein
MKCGDAKRVRDLHYAAEPVRFRYQQYSLDGRGSESCGTDTLRRKFSGFFVIIQHPSEK